MTPFADTQPAPLSALSGSTLDDFRVAAPAEVHSLLRSVADTGVTVHLTTDAGAAYTTTLWTVDAARARVSFSADEGSPRLQYLIDAGSAIAVCYLDAVKLQFRVHGLLLVRGANACALQGTLPAELFRFQRRASFRVRTLPRTSPTAHVPQPHGGAPLELRVLDVSLEGCALLLPQNAPPPPMGGRIERVHVELDADTRFETTLEIHHATSLGGDTGGLRLGCSMHRLTGDAQRALQRYIDGAQKKRRLFALE